MNKVFSHIRLIALLVVFSITAVVANAAITLSSTKCEMLVNPLGINTTAPRLSWVINSDARNTMQTAYQILVASTPEKLAAGKADLWDSGKVPSDRSIMVKYAGRPLTSRSACYWKVKVWTNKGESGWSAVNHWSVGLLKPTDWSAKWIGWEAGFPWDSVSKFSRLSARYFRKEFAVQQPIKKAVLYIAGPGHYQLFVNGTQPDDQVLAESPTDYTKSVKYNTFDVTKTISKGKNALGVVLGNGRFFTMRPKYKPKKIKEFGFPKLLLQLEITYQDGHRQMITSDDSWKFTADGPIRSNNEYDGEEYDARKELSGWNLAGFNDTNWLKPQLTPSPDGKLEAQMNEPQRVLQKIKPVSIKQSGSAWILDLGQNMAGWLQLKVKGKAGEQVTLRFAETLQKGGSIYTRNLRDAKSTDVYTLKGAGIETWHPDFVFHGFRFVEVSGYPGTPAIDDFEGQVVSDDLENTGTFETSDSTINHIYRNSYWGILSNYKGMPVDCPQRNERMPWLGDRAVGSLGESFVFANGNLYAKWLDDIEEAQTPEGAIPDVAPAYWNYYSDNMTWPGTYILVADMLYNQFDDKAPIEKHYASMKKWLDYMRAKYLKNDLMTKDKYGDWCVPPESPELIHSKDPARNTDGTLIATAYYYHLLSLMKGFAILLNKPTDAAAFDGLMRKTATAFNVRYFDQNTFRYDNNTVTANLLPLYFGMVPQAYQQQVFGNIVEKIKENNVHISTGVIGTQWLMRCLTKYGRADLAYRIAANGDYPSWGYMVNHGATTIWELWNGDTANPEMNSHNHIMLLGDLIAWYYQGLAGIRAQSPGFKTIEMKPAFDSGLSDVKASYRTPYGLIKSAWKKTGNGLNWQVTLPSNTKAVLAIPAKNIAAITIDGAAIAGQKDIKAAVEKSGLVKIEIGSGDYNFSVKN
ncbi:glycoside hydrolase family 78 protein [Mucilaginibacter sp. RS28]|uniref:alpha-L-rhamnosidase n=1 Tax=Mucilaginibacter straminoryzae TaxID=2932774 RepID=A0A9X1X2E7_9SPHI|nr:glycoside hydrolase family 78 protein [Mucilaginibacter straminoryzae]MCJ8210012.1 glycoside hydrolase family 78 protein [Mucilaginibacter straminoryzae]